MDIESLYIPTSTKGWIFDEVLATCILDHVTSYVSSL